MTASTTFAAHPDTARLAGLPPSEILIDADTGRVLYELDADVVRPPASMLKLMMMLMVVEGMEAGVWSPELEIATDSKAQGMGGTQVHLSAGETWPLARMMRAVAIASANDASMAVAQTLWGSEAGYLAAMNERAQALGMTSTVFRSVHGLPPDEGEDFDETTARDMALLARECVQRPLIMNWVGKKEMEFRPGETIKYSTNKLLWRMEGCDGLKTGFIRAAGFCIAATAEREGIRLIAVVMGHPTKYGRFNRAQELMEDGFAVLKRVTLAEPDVPVGPEVAVTLGDAPAVRLAPEDWIRPLLTADEHTEVRLHYALPESVEAPVTIGQRIGTMSAYLGDDLLGETALLSPIAIPLEGWKLVLRNGEASWIGLKP